MKSISPFVHRHIGPRSDDIAAMLDSIGYDSLDDLTRAVVPSSIFDDAELKLPAGLDEEQALAELKQLASENEVLRSCIGQGYHDTFTPRVIQRNVFENPAWYTAYTPYQPEISQGRLEVLFYFQTMVAEICGMDIANASLLDESTAAAEAMTLCHRTLRGKKQRFLASKYSHPQTLAVLRTRAEALGIDLVEWDESSPVSDWTDVFGVLLQYPRTGGEVIDLAPIATEAHDNEAMVVMAADLLALMLLKSPGELGADVVVGNSQRYGVPMGMGGPHAGFFATRDAYKRTMPGRLVGQSIDVWGNPAYRLALQTREQHIRREKATSNICTAQALLAIMATLYACYHGPRGLREIADRVHSLSCALRHGLEKSGLHTGKEAHFDTVSVDMGERADEFMANALTAGYNLRRISTQIVSIALDETTSRVDVQAILVAAGCSDTNTTFDAEKILTGDWLRSDSILTQDVFHLYHSETEMMRYLKRLADKDVALDRAMIPLGSCTMKLNAATEMTPVSWPEFARIHPYAPREQWSGYLKMIEQLEDMLCACTGYDSVSLQPNAGSQGEYAGLLAIKRFHESNGELERDICLIPQSAHGTNPASAQMANMKVVVVSCDDAGNVDIIDLEQKIAENTGRIAAIMITYPSTHGVFEEDVTQVCDIVHAAGGQVYIDGANLNALVGVAAPGQFGGDVSHLNLHKTFCIPHGGGGPGVGPIGVKKHLAAFLPADSIHPGRQGPIISGAPFGSASILPISWMYIRMMGGDGLRLATQVAILNANYIARELAPIYPILYTGKDGLVAHECIVDTRWMKEDGGITVEDIAKRLIDFGFHAPTMSFPVPGTLMIEPTESESLQELNRLCRAMRIIHSEYESVLTGSWPSEDNPLVNAPHTLDYVINGNPNAAYPVKTAICPDPDSGTHNKYWPPVGRIDNVHGDRHLICSCPPMDSYAEDAEESGDES
jgi:glycine dehydrogenase